MKMLKALVNGNLPLRNVERRKLVQSPTTLGFVAMLDTGDAGTIRAVFVKRVGCDRTNINPKARLGRGGMTGNS